MLSCWLNLFFSLSPTSLYFSSFYGMVVCGWRLRIDRVLSLSPSLALLTHFNDNNNNNKNFLKIIL